jgi:serine/threonine-protein kinase
MRLASGVWLTPTVRLIRPLRQGGMSSVWAAADMRLHTQVAVKVLARRYLDEPNAHARFEREGRLARLIDSPHVVHTFEQGTLTDGTPFIVMEWLEGESLKERLERDGWLAPHATSSVVHQVCRALDKAHAIGVIHRDIKPDNVFLMRSGNRDLLVKLLDFGIAKRIQSEESSVVTDRHEALGTPSYMSPEQLRNAGGVDFRSDLWSVGVLAYRMLLGRNPFTGRNFPAVCMAICDCRYIAPSQVDPAWPPELDRFFERLFRVDREARFASAGETASALGQALAPLGDQQPAGATSPSLTSGAPQASLSGLENQAPAADDDDDDGETLRIAPR